MINKFEKNHPAPDMHRTSMFCVMLYLEFQKDIPLGNIDVLSFVHSSFRLACLATSVPLMRCSVCQNCHRSAFFIGVNTAFSCW